MSLFMRVRSFLYRMGIRAVPLVAERPLGLFMYYGGGTFLNVKDSFQGVSVEAYYADLEKEPAILMASCGKGKALLSGVHYEYDPEYSGLFDPYLKQVACLLKEMNNKMMTENFLKGLMKKLFND